MSLTTIRLKYASTAVSATLLLSACAGYAWTSETSPANVSSPIAVHTVQSDGSENLALERLTAQFTQALQDQGLRGARWSEVPGEGYLECVLTAARVSGFGARRASSIRADCEARCGDRVFQLSRDGRTLRRSTSELGRHEADRRAQLEAAATRALRRVAAQVAARCGER